MRSQLAALMPLAPNSSCYCRCCICWFSLLRPSILSSRPWPISPRNSSARFPMFSVVSLMFSIDLKFPMFCWDYPNWPYCIVLLICVNVWELSMKLLFWGMSLGVDWCFRWWGRPSWPYLSSCCLRSIVPGSASVWLKLSKSSSPLLSVEESNMPFSFLFAFEFNNSNVSSEEGSFLSS